MISANEAARLSRGDLAWMLEDNRPLCRELFIREGLVNGEINTQEEFFAHNLKLINEVLELEEKSRRRDLLVNDDTLFAFYDDTEVNQMFINIKMGIVVIAIS